VAAVEKGCTDSDESCSEQQRDAGETAVELRVEQPAVEQQWAAGGATVGCR
jgi:hypothetical protein